VHKLYSEAIDLRQTRPVASKKLIPPMTACGYKWKPSQAHWYELPNRWSNRRGIFTTIATIIPPIGQENLFPLRNTYDNRIRHLCLSGTAGGGVEA
jgi:hypothetical protein